MTRYHHDVWLGVDLGGYWYTSCGRGRNGQSVSNKRWYGAPGSGYKVVAK